MADPIRVEFENSFTGAPTGQPSIAVHTREAWSDSWTYRPDLWLNELRASLSPAVPIASFTWRYGRKLVIDTYVDTARLDLPRQFVRVTVSDGVSTLKWYGTIDIQGDDIHGTMSDDKATGQITFTAYGLEKLLDDITIGECNVSASWLDATPLQCSGCPDFNAGGVPNRNKDIESRPAYVFRKPEVGADPEIVDYWTTANIVDYLLAYYVPQTGGGVQVVPFERTPYNAMDETGSWLPDFDKPVVPAEGRTAKGIIDALVTRQRGVAWWLEVNSDETKVMFRTASLSPIAVTLDNDSNELPEAARQIELISEADSSARLSMVTNSADTFDRVIVRGAKRTTTLTLRHDETIEEKWKEADADTYNEGAETGSTTAEKQRYDHALRSHPELRSVYAWFGLPKEWNQKNENDNAVFVGEAEGEGEPPQYNANPIALRILPTLALEFEADYTSESTVTTGRTLAYRPILTSVPLIKDDEFGDEVSRLWFDSFTFALLASNLIETPIYKGNKLLWSARAQVIQTPSDSIIEFRVQGEPQHTIAKGTFIPADTYDPAKHQFDWRDFLWTVTVEEDRYCEYAFPAAPSVDDPLVRTMILDAGEGYRLDRLLRNTVLSVNADGTLKRSPGNSFYCRDDRPRLEVMARMANVWYGRQRRAIRFMTHLFTDSLQLGDLILTVGDPDTAGDELLATNSTVTEIAISCGHSESGRPPPIRISYATDFAELDPLQVNPSAKPRAMTTTLDAKGLVR